MRDFSEIIKDLQNEEEFCTFTEEELIELVNFVKDGEKENTKDGISN